MTEKPGLFDDKRNVDRVVWLLVVACVVVQLADLVIHKHGHYHWEEWFGFHGWYGFVSCVALVVAATFMRRFVMRSEDYYGD